MRDEAIKAAAMVWSTAVTDVPWEKLSPDGQAVMIQAAAVAFDAILDKLSDPSEEMLAVAGDYIYDRISEEPDHDRIRACLRAMLATVSKAVGGGVNVQLPDGSECLSEHPTEDEARESAHGLFATLPAGWAMYLAGDDASGFKVVQYPLGSPRMDSTRFPSNL